MYCVILFNVYKKQPPGLMNIKWMYPHVIVHVTFCFVLILILWKSIYPPFDTVRLWSLLTWTNLVCYKGHNHPVWDLEFRYQINSSH